MIFLRNCIIIVIVCLFISSCATILTGTKQNIIITSNPPNASVELNGKVVGTTPLDLKLKKSLFKTQIIRLQKDNYYNEIFEITKKLQPLTLLNFFYTGLPLLIDMATGSCIRYDYLYSKTLSPNPTENKNENTIENKNENLIVWTKETIVNWGFFQGEITDKKTYDNSHVGAVTCSWINYQWQRNDSIVMIKTYSVMDTKKSWVKKTDKNDEILNHEKRHFDISEIYARKLKEKRMSIPISHGISIKTVWNHS